MTLSIRNPQADQLARRLAQIDGSSITDAVVTALKETVAVRLRNETPMETADRLLAEHGLKRSANREPLPDDVYHDLDEDLTGHYDD